VAAQAQVNWCFSRKRICRIFSSDGSGSLGLYEFLLLFSSLSERAPRETKLHYAFKIYDFDQDNFIGVADIEQAVKLLTQGQLSQEEVGQVSRKVLEEADIDDDKKLSSSEFAHVINKAPDFLTTFNIRV
jgi:Ca2+-binding EF-hand superfamily protein